jgi:hypothetical protein
MNELLGDTSRSPSRCTVIPLRPHAHVLESVTFVLGGRLLGTFNLNAPYAGGEPLRLYVVPQWDHGEGTRSLTADCLISDTDLG